METGIGASYAAVRMYDSSWQADRRLRFAGLSGKGNQSLEPVFLV